MHTREHQIRKDDFRFGVGHPGGKARPAVLLPHQVILVRIANGVMLFTAVVLTLLFPVVHVLLLRNHYPMLESLGTEIPAIALVVMKLPPADISGISLSIAVGLLIKEYLWRNEGRRILLNALAVLLITLWTMIYLLAALLPLWFPGMEVFGN